MSDRLEENFDRLEPMSDRLEENFDRLELISDRLEENFDRLEPMSDRLEGNFDRLEPMPHRLGVGPVYRSAGTWRISSSRSTCCVMRASSVPSAR
jgi:hypothetical protein